MNDKEKNVRSLLKRLVIIKTNRQIDLIDSTVNSLYGQENIDCHTIDKVLSIIQKLKL